MKMSVKGNVNVKLDLDLEFDLNEFEDAVTERGHTNVKEYDYHVEAILPIIKYFNKMALWISENGTLPKRRQEFFVYNSSDIDFILSQVINPNIISIQEYPDFEQCFWLTLKLG